MYVERVMVGVDVVVVGINAFERFGAVLADRQEGIEAVHPVFVGRVDVDIGVVEGTVAGRRILLHLHRFAPGIPSVIAPVDRVFL